MSGFSNTFRRSPRILSRRNLLRGAGGAVVAIPCLSSLTERPAWGATGAPKRLVVVCRPNGVWPANWWPTAGASPTDFQLNTATAPLAKYKSKLTFVDGIDMPMAERGVSPGDEHQRGMGACLTGRKNQAGTFTGVGSGPSGYADGISVDQYLARLIDDAQAKATGQRLPIGSLNLGVFSESTPSAPNKRRMIFSAPGQPVPSMEDPAQVYKTVFAGRTATPSATNTENEKTKSILDAVLDQFGDLQMRSGADDRQRLQQHADFVRSIETRLSATQAVTCAFPPAPAPTNAAKQEDAIKISRLQIDLMVTALACDLTRVATLQYVNSDNQYPFVCLPGPANDHSMGHTEAVASTEIGLTQDQGITRRLPRHVWYATEFAYLLEKMSSIPEGNGTMLDNSVVFWMSDLATGGHSYTRMPYVLAGGAGGALPTGRIAHYTHRSNCDLFVSLLNLFGFSDTTFGDPAFCKGALDGLF